MGRRRTGTGVEPLKSCIRITFVLHGKRCRETINLAPTSANIKATERMMARIFQEIALGVFDYEATFPKSPKASKADGFTSYEKGWLDTVTAEKSTMQGYSAAIHKVWAPIFKQRPLESIKPSEIKWEIARITQRVTGKTINNSLIPLRGVFEMAIDDGLIDRSPLQHIRNLKHQEPGPDPFDRAEMERIL